MEILIKCFLTSLVCAVYFRWACLPFDVRMEDGLWKGIYMVSSSIGSVLLVVIIWAYGG